MYTILHIFTVFEAEPPWLTFAWQATSGVRLTVFSETPSLSATWPKKAMPRLECYFVILLYVKRGFFKSEGGEGRG